MNKENAFKQILEEAKKYKKPSVPFELEELKNDDVLTSKLMGVPYWEKDVKFPLNENGHPLQMIAQINLTQMPNLPSFPKEGILQFFIRNDGDMYGVDFENPINHHANKVIYWPNPSLEKCVSYPIEEIEQSPINIPLGIKSKEINFEICGISDEYNFQQQYVNDLLKNYPKIDEDDFFDFLADKAENTGSKMGGYAYFTQSDPRAYENETLYKAFGCKKDDNKEFIILLQLDSDHKEMMWGDCGVANWFILKEDLEKLDFSRVFYTWDCC